MARRKVVFQESKPSGPSDADLVVRHLQRAALEAQTDPVKFYALVMKHETTRVPLIPAPHQVLCISAMMFHDNCVIRMPIGTGKTFLTASMALFLTGNDVTQRGVIVSKTAAQAQKPLGMVKDYIEEKELSPELRIVFPDLMRSTRPQDSWTRTILTVDRPPGIRDATLMAAGFDTEISGSRLSWIVGDDIVSPENCSTEENRSYMAAKFEGKILSRRDPMNTKAWVTNTPWQKDDLTYHLERKAGWPAITMDIYGNIEFSNMSPKWVEEALQNLVRPSVKMPGHYRLRAFDPDEEEETPLWPDRYNAQQIKEIRYGKDGRTGMLPQEFARTFLCRPFSAEDIRCQQSWIDRCKLRGMGLRMLQSYEGGNPTYTGIDLGIGTKAKHDRTVFFTFELQPDGSRRILDIESGHFSGDIIIEKASKKAKAYGSIIYVETVAGQDFLRQWMQKVRKDLQIRKHNTGINKHSVDFGVESVFLELHNEAWIIPCDKDNSCHREIQMWIDGCVSYQPPPAHTSDHLMACWIGREGSRRGGSGNDPKPKRGKFRQMTMGGGF